MSDLTTPQGPLLRALASSSTARRRAAMAQLHAYLSSSRQFTSIDLLKLWKALFYCLYMTPRPRNQQHLSQEISALSFAFAEADKKKSTKVKPVDRAENLALFIEAFWITIAREWEGIDKVRLDKFLFLIRRMVFITFETCKSTTASDVSEEDEYTFDSAQLARHIAILGATPLAPRDNKIPVGLRLHVLDVLVDELARADPEGKLEVETVLVPVERLKKESLTKTVRTRAAETLSDERIATLGQAGEVEQEAEAQAEAEDEEDDGGWGGFED
ncbi:hypothetical protein K461DRAFT_275935 [Myriangium duriaei CBS 260.36]|uniref:Ribosomal RNA-processing protein 1 n=1 Tax=Myriangium duriaei CBS 260.36 TaxID=1168546 RepID=A0A9P4J546_9PEZI|nr:hypothetical protein K461DRAFT_275935 [Myriangium duriaei CBS 260.36]